MIDAFWYVILSISIIFVWIISPLMIVYYESNENETFVRRILKSFRAQLPLLVVLILLVVPTYFSKLNNYVLPVEIATEYGVPAAGSATFFLHTYTVTVWLGELFFAFFAGVGLIVMPYDLMMEFIYRPQPINEKNFNQRKNILLPMTLKLRKEVKRLNEERSNVENM